MHQPRAQKWTRSPLAKTKSCRTSQTRKMWLRILSNPSRTGLDHKPLRSNSERAAHCTIFASACTGWSLKSSSITGWWTLWLRTKTYMDCLSSSWVLKPGAGWSSPRLRIGRLTWKPSSFIWEVARRTLCWYQERRPPTMETVIFEAFLYPTISAESYWCTVGISTLVYRNFKAESQPGCFGNLPLLLFIIGRVQQGTNSLGYVDIINHTKT